LIYGPPAAGKFTVAQALAARFDVRVLDNHVAVDSALRLFAFGDRGFFSLVQTIRVAMLESAAKAGLDVVSTLAYAHPIDVPTIERLLAASTSHGAEVAVVQLLPSAEEVRRRVSADSRRTTNKISDPDLFDEVVNGYDLRTPYPGTDVTIDNTEVAADAVAEQLARKVGFRPR
jgi:hypothetical protein